MKQAVAGVSPATVNEVTTMCVWPSLAANPIGRFLGRLYDNDLGFPILGIPITVGRLMALATIPLVLPVYFHMLIPRIPLVIFGFPNPSCRRYRLTNRRIVVENPFGDVEQKHVSLGNFDTIEIVQEPGQKWYKAGDLVFKKGPVETFRLEGIAYPEAFRQTCMKANQSFIGVQKARDAGVAV